jgi:hypothetical protein
LKSVDVEVRDMRQAYIHDCRDRINNVLILSSNPITWNPVGDVVEELSEVRDFKDLTSCYELERLNTSGLQASGNRSVGESFAGQLIGFLLDSRIIALRLGKLFCQ